MKNFLLGILFMSLISAVAYQSSTAISDRSKTQMAFVVNTSNHESELLDKINSYYKQGYRVVSTTSYANWYQGGGSYKVLIIMEK